MHRWLPELIAAPLYPLLLAQGKHARRTTPRLPEASEPHHGLAGCAQAGKPLSLIALGESPVAGVGVASHQEAITGKLATALAERLARPVAWHACGRNGATVRDALEHLLPTFPAAPVDIALVAFGVNDSTAFRPVARWRDDMQALLDALEARCRPRLILLSGVPPMAHFPALPQPLRAVMGLKSRALDAALQAFAAQRPRTQYVALAIDPRDPELMAADGYHPSARGCAAWAALLADCALPHLR